MGLNKETTDKFKVETGKVIDSYGQPYTKDYIEWLEQKAVKLFAIPSVIDTVCDNCTAYPFLKRGETPLCNACKDNPKQIGL